MKATEKEEIRKDFGMKRDNSIKQWMKEQPFLPLYFIVIILCIIGLIYFGGAL